MRITHHVMGDAQQAQYVVAQQAGGGLGSFAEKAVVFRPPVVLRTAYG
jgi:hypothetical protein